MPEAALGSMPFWAICAKCRHCWIAAYYPLELGLFASIAKPHARSPKCDGTAFVAKQEKGILLEPTEAAGG